MEDYLTSPLSAIAIQRYIPVVGIPIIVLYSARIRTSQKVSLGVFLCLSLVMAPLTIKRASKIHGAVSIDL